MGPGIHKKCIYWKGKIRLQVFSHKTTDQATTNDRQATTRQGDNEMHSFTTLFHSDLGTKLGNIRVMVIGLLVEFLNYWHEELARVDL